MKIIDLKISSREYSFRSAEASLSLFEGEVSAKEATQPAQEASPKVAYLVDNVVRGLEPVKPAKTFVLLLSNLKVIRLRDSKSFHIPFFVHGEFELTSADLEKGTKVIAIDPQGVYKVVAIDAAQRPIPYKKIHFGNAVMFSSELKTDARGELVFLGNPTYYIFSLGREEGKPYGLMFLPI